MTTYTDSTVTAGSTHTYDVMARDAAGNVLRLQQQRVGHHTDRGGHAGHRHRQRPGPSTATARARALRSPSTRRCAGGHHCKPGLGYGRRRAPSTRSYTGLAEGTHTRSPSPRRSQRERWTPTPAPASSEGGPDRTGRCRADWRPAAIGRRGRRSPGRRAADADGVAGYDVYRDGALLGRVGTVTVLHRRDGRTGRRPAPCAAGQGRRGEPSAFGTAGVRRGDPSACTAPTSPAAPYLTDLVGLNAIVNFATDRSDGVASVSYGAVTSGVCSPTTTGAGRRSRSTASSSTSGRRSSPCPRRAPTATGPYLGADRSARAQHRAAVPDPGAAGFPRAFLLRRVRRLGPGRRLRPEPRPGQRHAADREQRCAVRASPPATTGTRRAARATTATCSRPAPTPAGSSARQHLDRRRAASIRVFPAIGNHGLPARDASHPHLVNWPQDRPSRRRAAATRRTRTAASTARRRRAIPARGTRSTPAPRASTCWMPRGPTPTPAPPVRLRERRTPPTGRRRARVPVAASRPGRPPVRPQVRVLPLPALLRPEARELATPSFRARAR